MWIKYSVFKSDWAHDVWIILIYSKNIFPDSYVTKNYLQPLKVAHFKVMLELNPSYPTNLWQQQPY